MLTNVVFHSSHLPLASKKVFARQTTRDDVIAFFKTMREALLFRWPRFNSLLRDFVVQELNTIVAVPASSSGDVETSMEVTTNER